MREFFKNIVHYRGHACWHHASECVYFFLKMIRSRLSVFFHCSRLTIGLIIFLFIPSQVFAVAGDVVSNTASVNFFYLGVPLTQESSPTGNTLVGAGNGSPTTFIEDQVVNFSVVANDAAAVDVVVGETDAILTFTISNNGNATQDFLLTAINTAPNPFGIPVDNFDPVAPLLVFVESGANAGYLLAEDTALFIDDLAPGATAMVYVVVDIPLVAVGDLAAVALVVQVAVGGAPGEGAAISNDDNNQVSPAGTYSNGATAVATGTPNNAPDSAGVDLVFGDPAGAAPEDVDSAGAVQDTQSNGQHSDSGAFLVQSPAAAVDPIVKSVTVIDTLGGTDPHPGAILRYQLEVTTTGASSVDNLVITDAIPANTTYTPNSITLNGVPQTDAIDEPVDYSEFDGAQIIVDLSQNSTVSISTATTYTIVFDVTID